MNSSSGTFVFDTSANEHKPQYDYWPYIRFGELQYLHYLVEQGVGSILTYGPGQQRSPTSPPAPHAYEGIATAWGNGPGEDRVLAWGNRDLQLAAGIYPYNPANRRYLPLDGSQIGQYLNDLASLSCKYPVDLMTSLTYYGTSGQVSYTQSTGNWMPGQLNGNGNVMYMSNGSDWQRAYQVFGFAFGYGLRQDANCGTVLGYIGTLYNHELSTFGGWQFGAYYSNRALDSSTALADSELATHAAYPVNSADSQYFIVGLGGSTLASWKSNGNPYFAFYSYDGWNPSNGDRVFFCNNPSSEPANGSCNNASSGGTSGPRGTTPFQVYYIRDCTPSGGSCTANIATTPTGTPIVITNTGSTGPDGIMGFMPSTDVADTVGVASNNGTYPGWVNAAASWIDALGEGPGLSALEADQQRRITTIGGTLQGDCCGARMIMQASF